MAEDIESDFQGYQCFHPEGLDVVVACSQHLIVRDQTLSNATWQKNAIRKSCVTIMRLIVIRVSKFLGFFVSAS